MRGRYPAGPEYVDQLDGTCADKERLKVILDTLSGAVRVQEACAKLAIGASRFQQLREQALQGALAAIAPRPAGRPRRPCTPAAERIGELEEALRHKELEVHAAQVREEVALILPQAVAAEPQPQKKTRRRVKPR